MRRADRWLIGLVSFLITIVVVACAIGFTALKRQADATRRQSRATCFQLISVEQGIDREHDLASAELDPIKRQTHTDSEVSLSVYASGLRAIVPNCPRPPRPQQR